MEPKQFTLKELRARKNWTQRRTAQELGVSEQTYNAWEKDISNIAVSKVSAVAKLFGVTLDQIFFTKEHENNSCK
ncbi:MAG: helix-turn-helix transcriptional regulator [Anaerostipes sp.]|nr:helix-turn-helix transcriptional regulator [Anaerostipes sp.]